MASCDTFVCFGDATADGGVIFGKNSDRTPNEAQGLLAVAARDWPAGATVRCTYLSIPQVSRTHAVVLSKPTWIWGAEMGANEHGVVIGNEALFTRVMGEAHAPCDEPQPLPAGFTPPHPPVRTGGKALLGMDLVRLALERARSTSEAVGVLTGLLEAHGQGGATLHPDDAHVHACSNTFIVVDRTGDGAVIETARREWVLRRYRSGVVAVSNAPTIQSEWDLASRTVGDYALSRGWITEQQHRERRFDWSRVYSKAVSALHPIDTFNGAAKTFFGAGAARQSANVQCLSGLKVTPERAMDALRAHTVRGHSADPTRGVASMDVCAHASAGPIRVAHTTGSMVSHLPPPTSAQPPVHWVTGTSTPCVSVYKPVFVPSGLVFGPAPHAFQFDAHSMWWKHEVLHRLVNDEYRGRRPRVADRLQALQQQIVARTAALVCGGGPAPTTAALTALSRSCFTDADALTTHCIADLQRHARTTALPSALWSPIAWCHRRQWASWSHAAYIPPLSAPTASNWPSVFKALTWMTLVSAVVGFIAIGGYHSTADRYYAMRHFDQMFGAGLVWSTVIAMLVAPWALLLGALLVLDIQMWSFIGGARADAWRLQALAPNALDVAARWLPVSVHEWVQDFTLTYALAIGFLIALAIGRVRLALITERPRLAQPLYRAVDFAVSDSSALAADALAASASDGGDQKTVSGAKKATKRASSGAGRRSVGTATASADVKTPDVATAAAPVPPIAITPSVPITAPAIPSYSLGVGTRASTHLYDAIVIGGGPAGMMTARELVLRHGISNVLVLEARDRVGGRTWSVPVPELYDGGVVTDSYKIDIGGQWLGPTQTRALALAAEFGLTTYAQRGAQKADGQSIVVIDGVRNTYHGVIPALPSSLPPLPDVHGLLSLDSSLKWLDKSAFAVPKHAPWLAHGAASLDGMSVRDWYERHVSSSSAQQMVKIFTQVVFGSEPQELSLLFFLFYVHSAGGAVALADVDQNVNGAQSVKIHGGTQQLTERMAADLNTADGGVKAAAARKAVAYAAASAKATGAAAASASGSADQKSAASSHAPAPAALPSDGERVHLKQPAQRLEQFDSFVRVYTRDRQYEARRVVMALTPTLAGRIGVQPPFPAKRDQMTQRMPMGSIIKCFAFYKTAWWSAAGFNGLAIDTNGPLCATFDASSPDGSHHALVGFVAGKSAQHWTTQPKTALRAAVLEHLGILFDRSDDAAGAVAFIAQDWPAEEFSRGCYVGIMPPGLMTTCGEALRERVGRVHFAGTESASEWSGYIEGALQSGMRAASEVAALL